MPDLQINIAIGDSKFDIEIGSIQAGTAEVSVNGKTYQVGIENYAEIAPHGVLPFPPSRASSESRSIWICWISTRRSHWCDSK